MTYVFNKQFFARMPLLTEAEIRADFKNSFETWSDVDCSGRAPFFAEQAPGVTATKDAQFSFKIQNESLLVARTRAEWQVLGHDENALALTLLWHSAKTGAILDVDMEFNTGAGRFTHCDRACGRDMMDLQNTVTHEAGHVLGLGHSTVPDSTMLSDALDGETSKRTLEADDRQGYCSLKLPEFVCKSDKCVCEPPEPTAEPKPTAQCAVRSPGVHGAAPLRALIAFFCLGLWRGARRRQGATLRPFAWPARPPRH
jgi:hypothetical protein